MSAAADEIETFFCVEEEFFEIEMDKKTIKKKLPLVYCRNVHEYLDFLMIKRNFFDKENLMFKIGIDKGKGSLKVSFTLSYSNESETESSNGYLYSGVKKTGILAIVHAVPENYHNVQLLIEKLGLQDLFGFEHETYCAADLKMHNLAIGIQSHSSTFPCGYCEIHTDNLRGGKSQFAIRTFGSIRLQNQRWIAKGAKSQDLKNFNNCIHVPVFTSVDDLCRVIDVFYPSELHLLIGIVNHLIDYARKNGIPGIEAWITECQCEPEGRGEKFNGNSCRKLLKNHKLMLKFVPLEFQFIQHLMGSMNAIVESCFGSVLDPTYREKIDHFEYLMIKYEIPWTPKVHILIDHVPDFIEEKGHPLGLYSEQSLETIHFAFDEHLSKFKIKPSRSDFPKKLLRAVTLWNLNAI